LSGEGHGELKAAAEEDKPEVIIKQTNGNKALTFEKMLNFLLII